MHTQNIDFNVGLPDAAHQHGTDDNGQIDQIDATVDTKGLLFDRIGIKRAFGHFLLKEVGVNGKINREQNRERHQKRQDQMLRRPEERHSAQEAQEQRRIAQGRQTAADVGYDEDEEHEGVHLVATAFVGGQQRTNQQHGSTGRTHKVGDKGAHKEDAGIDDRTTDEATANVNAAGHDKESADEQNKGHVVADHGVRNRADGHLCREGHENRDHAAQPPSNGDLAVVVVPQVGSDERHKGNGQKNARKRNCPSNGEFRTVETCCRS